MAQRDIVVLGGGFGGLSTVRELQRHLPASDRITLIDRTGDQFQGLSLLWLMRGWRQPEDVRVVPTARALGRARRVTAEVTALDLQGRTVRTSGGDFGYDALVLALGARNDTAALPGLDQALAAGSAAHYYSAEAAVDAHARLRAVRSGRVVVLVSAIPYRCPAAPYEGALLAGCLLSETGARDSVALDVFTPEPQPMPVAGPVVGQAVVSLLEAQKIGFHPGHQAERVDAAAREVVFADGTRAPFDLLLVVPPHRPPEPVAAAGFSPAGWVPVDAHTLRTQDDRVWAMGDNAAITLTNGKPLPKAAVFARGQAEAVAAGIARELGHDAPEPYFTGHGHCYIETGGRKAAKGEGDFYHPDGPQVAMSEPSEELHREKGREESGWLELWSANGSAAPAG
ncbi:NAD(P)/FAD-dependent oxidoreductase [Streptomyces aidingensis]|uniref:Sulfide:quinone oxidoreductase n=1 Tax=Streptomyces aidingensis TaxID=910347 RepID=A0A1I1N5R5_9ACTN|nr:FAD/NAD(P)-binding oxidoreductase [Streptomyces aidingensis]SFC92959.1 sulfide:quinone oxidoreductase [Streptomyces aidingensis]